MGFNENIDKYTTNTPGHADELNKRQEKLLENDKYLKSELADMASRLKRLEDAVLSNITGNPFEISFKDLEGLKVTGIWNKEKQRLEV